MKTTLYLLTDYKGNFGNKFSSSPYRSGMDKQLLSKNFKERGFDPTFLYFSDVSFKDKAFQDKIILYTSSEDNNLDYKSYIEDICFGLFLQGANLIPHYKYLKAHSNKVFMEILRDIIDKIEMNRISARHFGCLEDLARVKERFNRQYVLKGAGGAKSSLVRLSSDSDEILKKAINISRSRATGSELWDCGRAIRHKGYVKESRHRKKFVVQNFVPSLQNDWKILIFGKKYYVLHRSTRKNDFRASGSGIFEFRINDLPLEILDFSKSVLDTLDVPNISLDIGFDGQKAYLFEFQAIYFGSYTVEKAPFYFVKRNGSWTTIHNQSVLENVYVESISEYILSSQNRLKIIDSPANPSNEKKNEIPE